MNIKSYWVLLGNRVIMFQNHALAITHLDISVTYYRSLFSKKKAMVCQIQTRYHLYNVLEDIK